MSGPMTVQRGLSARFTFDPAEETTGVWSRDGKMIAYRSARYCEVMHLKNSNGLEQERSWSRSAGAFDLLPNSWTVDDSQLLVRRNTSAGDPSWCSYRSRTSRRSFSWIGSRRNGQISPDDKWVAYETDESGNWEVYMTTFPATGGKLQVSRGGGREPRWRADGKEIFYIDPKGTVLATPVTVEGSLSTGNPSLFLRWTLVRFFHGFLYVRRESRR